MDMEEETFNGYSDSSLNDQEPIQNDQETPKKRGRPRKIVQPTDAATSVVVELPRLIYIPSEKTNKLVPQLDKGKVIYTKTFKGSTVGIFGISNITDGIALYKVIISSKSRVDYTTEVISSALIKPDIAETSEEYEMIKDIKFFEESPLPISENVVE